MDKKIKIGSVVLDNITIVAPLAGISDLPFRMLAKKAGCAMVCTEMISANGLVHQSKKTLKMLNSLVEEKPLSVQIFGADPRIMAKAAEIVEASGADIIDINFGCSVKKVLKTGAGSALMKNYDKAEMIIKAVRETVGIPLTIKIRSGWDPSGRQAFELAEIAQRCGVDAIAVHPRTATQKFHGSADWSIITAIKKNVTIPVIGNGDIVTADDAVKMLNYTGCDAVMIGRAGIGNPWIFSQVGALLRKKRIPEIKNSQRFETIIRYIEDLGKFYGENHACRMMRTRLGWFAKGLPGSKKFRESIKQIASQNEAQKLIKAYLDSIQTPIF